MKNGDIAYRISSPRERNAEFSFFSSIGPREPAEKYSASTNLIPA